MIAGKDFLTLAEIWINGVTEAQWRCAVSRAYYAAFHEARHLLCDLGFTVPLGDQAHAYLWLRLSNCGDLQVQLAGSDLNTLRRERNRSDYDVNRDLNQADALLQVRAAGRILQILDGAGKDPIRVQITDAMKTYERDILKVVTWKP
jgi:uncharacterized protein (UPF0332 family)